MTLLAYLFVLGAATPVFRIAYLLIPGLKMFRFPTRFLIVVELGLAVLGAIGLTRLRADLAGPVPAGSRSATPFADRGHGSALRRQIDLWSFTSLGRTRWSRRAIGWRRRPTAPPSSSPTRPHPRTFTPGHRADCTAAPSSPRAAGLM